MSVKKINNISEINKQNIIKNNNITNAVVDIIIPVYNPDTEFRIILNRLLKQTVLPNHIFLLQTIEDESELMTDLESDKISVHPVAKSEFDHGGTRHYGTTLSKADYVMFMTQDAVPKNNKLIEMLLLPMADKRIGISYARQLAREGADILEKLTRVYNYPKESCIKSQNDIEKLGIKTYFCSDVCALYRKNIYDELGGFVRKTIFNEDMIMASKVINAGYNIAYCADAKVVHSHSYTCMQQLKRNFDLGVSQKQYHEIFENISSEKEGAGYAKKTIKMLLKRGRFFKAFYFALQCGFKLVGFKLGKNYDKLPKSLVMKCTMSKGYWM